MRNSDNKEEKVVLIQQLSPLLRMIDSGDRILVLFDLILIFNLLIDFVYKSMPPKRRLSKPLVLTILVLNGFFCGYAATPLCGVIFL